MGYAFSRDHQRLEAGRSLSDQGVSAGQLLWFETDLQGFAGTAPAQGSLAATFRGDESGARAQARKELLAAIQSGGLGY